MSHEIRTPMNAILGYAQILEQETGFNEGQVKAVSTIKKSGQHLLTMINDILDLSKIEAGKMELVLADFDLVELVKDVSAMFETLCRQQGLRWESRVVSTTGDSIDGHSSPTHVTSCSKLWVHGDAVKLRQVLINLLGNAIKFTDTGGLVLKVVQADVSISSNPLATIDDQESSAADRRPDTYFCFEIIDTGKGISQEDQERIFQPFAQAEEGSNARGTGLGLNISRRQVELMGGRLEVESRLGQGSSFVFTLPFAIGTTEPVRAERQAQRMILGSCVRVLVVDDVEENRDVLSLLLEGIGADVKIASDGPQALSVIEEGLFDIVFLDIRMPGMSGVEVCRRITERLGDGRPPIVAVSASVLSHEQDQYLKQGFDAFIAKPFLIDHMCECLSSLLGVAFHSPNRTSRKEDDSASDEGENWSDLKLPSELLQRLRTASRTHNLTFFDSCLKELDELGPREKQLAATMRRLVEGFRLQRVQELLEQIHENK
jgi:CheY-like chemotaxis protein